MKFHVHVEPAEEGGYVITCPALPGCCSQGESVDEAIENIRDAIEGWLEVNDVTETSKLDVQVLEVAV